MLKDNRKNETQIIYLAVNATQEIVAENWKGKLHIEHIPVILYVSCCGHLFPTKIAKINNATKEYINYARKKLMWILYEPCIIWQPRGDRWGKQLLVDLSSISN